MRDVEKPCGAQTDLEVRECRLQDVAAVVEIHNYWIRRGGATMETREKSVEEVTEWLEESGSRQTMLVLNSRGVVEGWGIIKSYSDRPGYRVCCETAVYLRPNQLRKGYGSMIKKALIKRCREYGYHHLVAKIWADNVQSIEYNRKLGYEVVGIQKEVGHVGGEWRDICLMQLVLKDVPPFDPEAGNPPG